MERPSSAQVRFCTTRDGVNIAYAARGNGPPLVKTPNWLNHLQLDVGNVVWRAWIARLERSYTLVRYDARGCGLSDRTAADMSFAANQLDLEAVVDAAGLDTFALYGASQGAAIAIDYAARHRGRVSRLVLCGGYLQGILKRAGPAEGREEAAALLKLVELGWGRDNSAFRQVFATQFLPDATREQLQGFDEIQRNTVSPEGAARLLQTFYGIDVAAAAREVRCPTLVMHATHDARIPFEEGRRTAAAIPGAEFVALDTRNHIVIEQDPAWDRFFVEVDRFLLRAPGGVPAAAPDARVAALTAAELRVLELVAAGISNPRIAQQLGIAEKTVRNHINRIFSKLGAQDRSHAIVLARDAGMGRGTPSSAGGA